MSAENFFKQQPCAEPERRIVEADQPVNIQPGFAVIPGAGFKFPQERAGNIFSDKNAASIYTSP